jgi:hypothetical protein
MARIDLMVSSIFSLQKNDVARLVFHMPVIKVKKPIGMEKKDRKHGQNP